MSSRVASTSVINPRRHVNVQTYDVDDDWDEIDKEQIKTIDTKIKQIVCDHNKSAQQMDDRWKEIDHEIKNLHFDTKKIFEKLDDEDNYSALHHAVLSNNLDACKRLINNYKCNVNLIGWGGTAPLHLAARSAEVEKDTAKALQLRVSEEKASILLFLLNIPGIDINIKDNEERTPLHHAIMRGCINNARELISNRQDLTLTAKDVSGALPIHYACQFHPSDDMLNLFGNIHQWSEWKTYDNKTPVQVAAEHGHHHVVKKYFSQHSSPKGINEIVRAAVRHHTDDVLSYLQDHNLTNTTNYSRILHYACRQLYGHELIDRVIFNSEMSTYDNNGFTPLMLAVKHRLVESVRKLLDSQFCTMEVLETRTNDGSERTVLHICAEVNQEKITNALLEKIDRVLYKNKSNPWIMCDVMGNTALHMCAQNKNSHMCEEMMKCYIKHNSNDSTNDSSGRLTLWTMKNHNKWTALHEAIQKGHFKIVAKMYELMGETAFWKVAAIVDEDLRTSLHMAAQKGNLEIMELLVPHNKNGVFHVRDSMNRTPLRVATSDWSTDNDDDNKNRIDFIKVLDARDSMNRTPLHAAASWSTDNDDDNKKRQECIEFLVNRNADINATDLRRETPLHIACKSGSAESVKCLLKSQADLLVTNIHGLNCLEVAIEEENEKVVKYLLSHDRVFELMRNAQIEKHSEKDNSIRIFSSAKLSTPMRKLIKIMPDMALVLIDKCVIPVGAERSHLYKNIYNYEFFEDQYLIFDWIKGNWKTETSETMKITSASQKMETLETMKITSANQKMEKSKTIKIKEGEAYTKECKTVVHNHPLFLMAHYDQYKLIEHPLCKSLLYKKFFPFGFSIFFLFFLIYITFVGIFTTIALRVNHPEYYYNLTNINFDDSLCTNVCRVIANGTIGSNVMKQTADYWLKYIMYALMILILAKNIWILFGLPRFELVKIFLLFFQMMAVGLSFYFVFDYDYQQKVLMRCPIQWQIGAFGLFVSYMGIAYFFQYAPIIGVYAVMMAAVYIRFVLFLPALLVLISGFGLCFYMLFPNFDPFQSPVLSFQKIVMMISGELNFNDVMYSSDHEAYYKLGYIMYILFVISMTIITMNLLTGLAVGEIQGLLKQAKYAQLDMTYELVRDYEVLRLQLYKLIHCCRGIVSGVESYEFKDMLNIPWYIRFGKWSSKLLERELFAEELIDEPADDKDEQQMNILEKIQRKLKKHFPDEDDHNTKKKDNHQSKKKS